MSVLLNFITVPLWEGDEPEQQLGAQACIRTSSIRAFYPRRATDWDSKPTMHSLQGCYIDFGDGEEGSVLTTLSFDEVGDLLTRSH